MVASNVNELINYKIPTTRSNYRPEGILRTNRIESTHLYGRLSTSAGSHQEYPGQIGYSGIVEAGAGRAATAATAPTAAAGRGGADAADRGGGASRCVRLLLLLHHTRSTILAVLHCPVGGISLLMGVGRRVLVAHDAMDGDNGVAGSGVARVIVCV